MKEEWGGQNTGGTMGGRVHICINALRVYQKNAQICETRAKILT